MYSYGLEGYQILVLTLEFMFPNTSFDVAPFRPLDARAFREKVLLPEVGILLIQQDLPHINRASAIEILRTSQDLGSLLHPGTDSLHVDEVVRRVSRAMWRDEKDSVVKKEEVEVVDKSDVLKEVIENGKVVILLDD
jgi:hypothetical protein